MYMLWLQKNKILEHWGIAKRGLFLEAKSLVLSPDALPLLHTIHNVPLVLDVIYLNSVLC